MLEPVAAVVAVNTYVSTMYARVRRVCACVHTRPPWGTVRRYTRADRRDTQVRRIVDTFARGPRVRAQERHGGDDDDVVEERKLLFVYRTRITRLHEIAPRRIVLEKQIFPFYFRFPLSLSLSLNGNL